MSISDKDLKELWGKSGDRCAICFKKLHQKGDLDDYNIGEICHIISPKKTGPRHIDNYNGYDTYKNLILLCKIHHSEIDNSVNLSKYPIEELRKIKANHEKLVESLLNNDQAQYLVQLKWEINNLDNKDSIQRLLTKCRLYLSEIFNENDILISELSNIDFSTHMENDGMINNSVHLRIVNFNDGKKRLLDLINIAIDRIKLRNMI